MLPPIRCFSCNAIVPFREVEEAAMSTGDRAAAIRARKGARVCCLNMLVGHQDGLLDILMNTNTASFTSGFTTLRLGIEAGEADASGLPRIKRQILL